MADKMNKQKSMLLVILTICIVFLVALCINVTIRYTRATEAVQDCQSYAAQLEQALGETNAALTATIDGQELKANWHVSQAQDAISGTNMLVQLCYGVR
mgnify:CR=1 FL=1